MTSSCYEMFCVNYFGGKAECIEARDMQISDLAGGVPALGAEPCRFPKLEECAHFHYERVHLPHLNIILQTNMDQSLHSQHTNEEDDTEWYMIQVKSGEESWLLQRSFENFKMLDAQLHQCIYDRKISQLFDLFLLSPNAENIESVLIGYLERFSKIIDNSVNCGPVLNWLQMDNKGHRLLVPSEESRSINTPAVAAAYGVRRYVSQARDELNLEVGDMISVIDMASPGESMWWRGKRGFQVGFFPQHCVHIIGDKVPRNMPLPPPVVGSLAMTTIKPVLRKHGKLITFFRSFILNRPSRRRLKQSGILKERVFACDLGEHLLNSGHEIPMVLKCCSEFIEKNGIVDGIYRLSGVTSNIQKLRNAFDEDRIPDLYTEEILQDIHSVASLLKMYFRELPNPLCTYQLYQSFVNAVQGTGLRNRVNDHERLLKMREAVQKLPPPHYRTLEYLMKHLSKVANHGQRTGMTTRNVAIVWAPNLLRSAELEDGGVTALQGVGVQAVVTEFLICYVELIFCDRLPNLDKSLIEPSTSPKKSRPKSLAISTPTKLITLEEARNKHHLLNRSEDCSYIEVGGGPKNLPKKYHTIIELPSGARKRGHAKKSPLGWRSFFTKSRNSSQGNLSKPRLSSSSGMSFSEKSITESDLTDMRRKLRSVKSAESLTSGHSEPASNEIDVLGPLHSLSKPPGHNRSVSHDSYFDTLQNSQNNSEGSLLDLSEIQLNFDLEESEMRIFSEDESLVSSPKVFKDSAQRRVLTRARPEEFNSATNSGNPSPKKQPRVVLSPDALSRKRTRLEDQLSDIQYIDSNSPETAVVSTTVLIHTNPEIKPTFVQKVEKRENNELYQPKNKSPRNSDNLDKRQSLNLDSNVKTVIVKSYTDADIGRSVLDESSNFTSPQSPLYRQLGESSANTTPGLSPDYSPTEINYQSLRSKEKSNKIPINFAGASHTFPKPTYPKSTTPIYENILTTISITYKSPPRSVNSSPLKSPVTDLDRVYENVTYENVTLKTLNPEKAVIPTSTASLPIQQASQPELNETESTMDEVEPRPKSMNDLDENDREDRIDLRPNFSSNAVCDTNEQISIFSTTNTKTFGSNRSSRSNVQYTSSPSSDSFNFVDNCRSSPADTDLSLSEVLHDSSENLSTTSQASLSFPSSRYSSKDLLSPNVSPAPIGDTTNESESLLSTVGTKNASQCTLLDLSEKDGDYSFLRPTSINLIDFNSPQVENRPIEVNKTSPESFLTLSSPISCTVLMNEKRKSFETEIADDNQVYQQVKYFRRSIHEINALLDLENGGNTAETGETVNDRETTQILSDGIRQVDELKEHFDSLESEDVNVYENVDGASLKSSIYENVDIVENCKGREASLSKKVLSKDKMSVKDLLNKFQEGKNADTPAKHVYENVSLKSDSQVVVSSTNNYSSSSSNNSRLKKFYEKDSLPPCLRARNLKNQTKITRSLDEDEFKKEFELFACPRRKSVDESTGYKTNSLPKLLNPPKLLPSDADVALIESLHLSHSSENIVRAIEDQKKRERIEKYKQERRKILNEKYRSESFKEDKEVLLSRLKISKTKDDVVVVLGEGEERLSPVEKPTKNSHSSHKSEEYKTDGDTWKNNNTCSGTSIRSENSLKARAAVFEQKKFGPNNAASKLPQPCQQPQPCKQPPPCKQPQPCKQPIAKPRNSPKKEAVGVKSAQSVDFGFKARKNSATDCLIEDADFIRHKRVDDEVLIRSGERRRHTYDIRERESEVERLRRISLESRSPRKEKTSPTYCIKDMKAIFESKSKQ